MWGALSHRVEGKEDGLVSKDDHGRWMSAFRERDTGVQRPLDDLASGLASGTISRRKAFKLAGAALLSAVATPLASGTASAALPCCTKSFKCGRTGTISCPGTRPRCNPNCLCTKSVEGPIRCGNPSGCTGVPCNTTRKCVNRFGKGFFCQRQGTGCCGQVCIAPCGTDIASTARSTQSNAG
jgi:hypothetical protein